MCLFSLVATRIPTGVKERRETVQVSRAISRDHIYGAKVQHKTDKNSKTIITNGVLPNVV